MTLPTTGRSLHYVNAGPVTRPRGAAGADGPRDAVRHGRLGPGARDLPRDGYDEVAELWHAYGFRLEFGLTRMGQARCLLKLGRTDEATSRLLEAREVLTPLRALPALTEIDELLSAEAAETG